MALSWVGGWETLRMGRRGWVREIKDGVLELRDQQRT